MSRPDRGLRFTHVIIDEAVEWGEAQEEAARWLETVSLPPLGASMQGVLPHLPGGGSPRL